MKERSKSRKKEFQEQFRKVKDTELQLQQNWESSPVRLQLDQAQTSLETIRLEKLEKL